MKATAFAPATVANVASGFDILGFAIEGLGDRVTVSRTETPGVVIDSITSLGGKIDVSSIPKDASKNTATVPLLKMLEKLKPDFGFSVSIEKNIPLGSGLGGSAASAVGAVVAANALLEKPFSRLELLHFALEGEFVASGGKHADNIAPCLYGGFTLTTPGEHPSVMELPFSKDLYAVVVYPAMRLDTKVARAALSSTLPLKLYVEQSSRLAALIAGMCLNDLHSIHRGLEDVLIEPQRSKLIPGFDEVKKAALSSRVLGASISGAGPSVFALAENEEIALLAQSKMIAAFDSAGRMKSESWISPISRQGAHCV